MTKRNKLKDSRRWVVKVGSALLANEDQGLNTKWMQTLVNQMADLIQNDVQVCLVSSGAIAIGLQSMNLSHRPDDLPTLQAAAAIGQMGLVQAWQSCFQSRDLTTAQILLTHEDLANRQRYLNARETLKALGKFSVIPVVNENDTVATDEIRFGDNDSLAALATNLLEADVLVILTDQDGLYDKDPRLNDDAKLITEARSLDCNLLPMAGHASGTLGRGGMYTKIIAAQQAARSGAMTLIANGKIPDVLASIRNSECTGSLLLPDLKPQAAKKRWLASHKQTKGKLVVDEGASRALREQGRSLLPVGVVELHGHFIRGDIVSVATTSGIHIATGLINYDARQAERMVGKTTQELKEKKELLEGDALIHRDNMVLL